MILPQSILSAQRKSDELKPIWITQSLPKPKSNSYIFVSAHGEGSSLALAKQMAFVAMTQKLETERGLTINTGVKIKEELSQKQSTSEEQYQQEITMDVTEKGRKLQIVCREIDDYWTHNRKGYKADVLYTVADKNEYGGSYDDNICVTTKYGAAGLLSVIPGVGQYYKGSKVKGTMIIAGEVAAICGIVLCENTRASYEKKMIEQPKYLSQYNSRADSWETSRNVCVGAACAIYIYNMIDAITANGAKHIIINKRIEGVTLNPYFDTNCVGMVISYKF